MSALQVPAVHDADFRADASLDGNRIRARLLGNADMRAKDALEATLGKLHDEAMRLTVPEVVVDLHELEFMNSSCFKSFVAWISKVQELETEKKYMIRLLSKPELLWQRRSLHALRCFAVDLVTIEG